MDQTDVQSPIVHEENEEWSEQYDRQLRLWGVRGQEGITKAKILLLNGSATGTEVLKNLILPGVGEFTVLDNAVVGPEDFGNNFFVNRQGFGQSRAKVVTELLNELNIENTTGSYIEEDPKTVVDTNPDLFKNYNFVIGSQLDARTAIKVGKICADNGIPLLLARSYGLIGYLRLYHKCHEVIEGKLDNEVEDLRITCPWPELEQFALKEDVTQLDRSNSENRKAHSHIPYLCLLIQFLKKWKDTHDGKVPQTAAEKRQFKSMISSACWDPINEQNFSEASAKVYQAWTPAKIPDEVQAIFDDERCANLDASSSAFWICAAAVKKFVESEGQLPLPGSLPDMHGDTDRYIVLQTLFRRKARADRNLVKQYAEQILKQLNRPTNSIPDADILEFTKNIYSLRVYYYKTIEAEYAPQTTNRQMLANELANESSPAVYYFLLRAADRFAEKHNRFPGAGSTDGDSAAQMDRDVIELRVVVDEMLTELAIDKQTLSSAFDDHLREMVRYGAGELHNIAALVGGVGAQEVIKILTAQRLPLFNTWIYWGAPCSAQTIQA